MWRALVGIGLTLLSADFLTGPDTGWLEWVGFVAVVLLTLDACWAWSRTRRARRRSALNR